MRDKMEMYLLILVLICYAIPVKSEDLECEFKETGKCFNWIRANYVQCYTCKISNTTLKNKNDNVMIDWQNNEKSNSEVQKVEISGGVFNFIPEKIFQAFPEVTHLGIQHTTAEFFGPEFFNGADELKVFEYEFNKVKSLQANIFEYVTNLEVIDLDGNGIEEIHSDAFRNLFRLKSLVLSRNKLFIIDRLWFQDMQQLVKLEFTGCSIKNIDGRVFGNLKSLKRLFMDQNEIEKLETRAFKNNLQLVYIEFAQNKIKEIPTRLFSNLNKLNFLNFTLNVCINSSFTFQSPAQLELAMEPCKPTGENVNTEGSCEAPLITNGVIKNYDGETVDAGMYFDDIFAVKVVCNQNYSLITFGKDANSIICEDGAWKKDFPECKKLCSKRSITGPTIKSYCEYEGIAVPCNKNLIPGVTAMLACKTGYKKPNDKNLHTDLRCLESGEWSYSKFACEPTCGQLTPEAVAHVFKGNDASILEVPWHVAIYKNDKQICGGSIISEKIVVSAGHCFFDVTSKKIEDAKFFKVAAGKYYKNLNATENLETQVKDVTHIITDRSFQGYYNFFLADIALLIVKDYFEYQPHIAPVCLDSNSNVQTPKNGTQTLVAGWGLTEFGVQSETLKKITMPIVDLPTCKERAPDEYKVFVNDDKLCAGYTDDSSGVCTGDSGGGLTIFKNIAGEQTYFLEGIVSNGKKSTSLVSICDTKFVSVFTNVHRYTRMIDYAMKIYKYEDE